MKPVRAILDHPLCLALLFSTSLSPWTRVQATDVSFYGVLKNQAFTQTSAASPVQNGMFTFRSFARSTAPNLITAASLRLPNGSAATSPYAPDSSGLEWDLIQNFSLKTQMDSTYPSGNYAFSISTRVDGAHLNLPLTLPTDTYPQAPHISNFIAAQAIDASAGFTLTWDALTTGTVNDFVQLIIEDGTSKTMFQSPPPGQAGALNGTSTSVVIPANALAAGQTYQGELLFMKVASVNTTSYPGATGFGGFAETTTFALGTTSAGPASADVQFYLIQKRVSYAQTGTGLPALGGTAPYRFQATVIASGTGSVNSASIRLLNGTTQTLSGQAGSTEFQFKQDFSTTSALDTTYPVGSYLYTISTVHDGVKTPSLTMTADNYPAGPHISNFTAAQAVNAASSFTLTWDAFTGGGTNDLIEVEVDDALTGQVIFSTPVPGSPGTLDGTATSVVIPAGALTANQTYQAKITFDKVADFDETSYPGAQGITLFSARTTFNLATAGGTVVGLDVTQFHLAKGQSFTQAGTGAPTLNGATPYVFEASANLSTSNAATGSVKLPNGTVQAFTVKPDELQLKASYASQTNLDTAYPDGSYTVTFNTVDNGTKTVALNLSGSTHPSTPHISNFTAAQNINAGVSFTLMWDAFSGGAASDFISVEIDDSMGNSLFTTADIGTPGALNGTATGVVVPANALQPGQSYSARLLFVRGTALDTNSYPGAILVAGYFKETDFTVATAGGTVSGPDVQSYFVVKGQQFFQNGTNPPAPRADTPFVFGSSVKAQATGDVANVSVQLPNTSSSALSSQDNGLHFEFFNGFATKSGLDTAYPNGTYTLFINTVHNGLQKPALNLPTDNYPSTVPYFRNPIAAQTIDPTADFTLMWSPFAGGTTNDFEELSLSDSQGHTVFDTGSPGTMGALNGLAVAVVIPHGTLNAGQSYFVNLTFARGTLDTNSYPGAIGFVAYYTSTDFNLATKGANPPSPPTLSNPTHLANGTFQFRLTGQANSAYEIDASTSLANWIALTNVTTGADGTVDVTDPQATNFSARFYRAIGGGSVSASVSLSFNHYANAGTYGVNTTPQSVFPVPLNGYRAIFGVNNDSALPAATNVTFTGPAGSGLTNTPADPQSGSLGSTGGTYVSPVVQNPTAAPGGAWTVNYKGVPQPLNVPDPQANTRLVIPVPTVTITNGVLQQLNWIYRGANGSILSAPPSFMRNIQIQVSGQNFARLYDSPSLAPTTTSQTLPISPAINWSSVTSIAMAYEDDLGNTFIVFFYH